MLKVFLNNKKVVYLHYQIKTTNKMELDTLLQQYEKKVIDLMQTTCSVLACRKEIKLRGVYQFLINCGVSKEMLEDIEEKHGF